MLTAIGAALAGWKPDPGAAGHTDPLTLLVAGWADIVGPDVARNSHPTRVGDGILLVTTRSSAWSQQLSLLSEDILGAVRARLGSQAPERLRFRVGAIPKAAVAPGAARRRRNAQSRALPGPRSAAAAPATAGEALARFRATVEAGRRAKRDAGWKECTGCGDLVAPGSEALCIACANARDYERASATARLMFEAPWLGYAGTAALIDGLGEREYGKIRTALLARWWETLERARATKTLSRDGRERLIASSYVVLKSKVPPEEISPATVRNVLGDELHDLIYGTER